jgi:sigma-B regulation protein RsbU (phosphoserine phosphatase)
MVVADISGKGIPAALLLASTRARLRNIARHAVDPAELLTKLSAETYAEYEGLPYVTCLAMHLDTARRHVVYANAGHPPGVILGNGRSRFLDIGGPPLGLLSDASYDHEALALASGDVGMLVTDGITETLDALGYTPLQALALVLEDLGPFPPPQSVCDAIMRMVDSEPAGPAADRQDDRTIVVFAFEAETP